MSTALRSLYVALSVLAFLLGMIAPAQAGSPLRTPTVAASTSAFAVRVSAPSWGEAPRFVSSRACPPSALLNLYAYCGGDPVNRSDSSGLDWIWNKPPGEWRWDGQWAGQPMTEDQAVAFGFSKPTEDGDSPDWGPAGLPKDIEGRPRIGPDIDYWFSAIGHFNWLGIDGLNDESGRYGRFALEEGDKASSLYERNHIAMIRQLSKIAQIQRDALKEERGHIQGEINTRRALNELVQSEGLGDLSGEMVMAVEGGPALFRGASGLTVTGAEFGFDMLAASGRAFAGGTRWAGGFAADLATPLLNRLATMRTRMLSNLSGVNGDAVVHLTNKAGKMGIDNSKRIGGAWGIFALRSEQVPASAMGRFMKTLVGGDLSQEVRIGGPALSAFRAPPLVGIFSAARRFAGVRSTPLGTIDLTSGRFIANEIFKNGVFRPATNLEKLYYHLHQGFLDYGIDAAAYTIGGGAILIHEGSK